MTNADAPLRRRTSRRVFLLRAAAVGSVGLLAACAPAAPAAPTAAPAAPKPTAAAATPQTAGGPAAQATPAAAAGATKGKVTVALSSDVLTLDPSKDTSPISLNVYKNVFDQLSDIRADGSVGPQLAESWDSPDAVNWTFKLRTNAKFTDGKPVTVDDVLGTFQAVMRDEKSPVREYTTAIDKMEKVDERTIRFVTKYPYAPFPRWVSLISILPQDTYRSMGAEQFARKPVGSGPYSVVNWVKDDHLELAANPQYFGGAPSITSVIFRPVTNESSRTAGLESGDLDLVSLIPPPEVPRLQKGSGLHVTLVPSNRNLFLGFNTNTKPLDNQKVRQAIDCAINREQICNGLLNGMGKPVGQCVAEGVFGHDPSIAPTKFDPDRARQLLKDGGFPNGVDVDMQYPSNRYAFGNEVAQAIVAQLADVGIRVKLEAMEYAAFFPNWTGKKLRAIYLFAFGPSIMDADLPLSSLYSSDGRVYWTSPEVDALVKKQRGQANDQERAQTISQIWKISQDQVPYSWLYTEIQAYGIRDRLDFTPRKDERFNMKDARLGSA